VQRWDFGSPPSYERKENLRERWRGFVLGDAKPRTPGAVAAGGGTQTKDSERNTTANIDAAV